MAGREDSEPLVLSRLYNLKLTTTRLALLISCGLVGFYNDSLWSEVFAVPYESAISGGLFTASFFVFLVAFLNLLLSFVAFPYLLKPLSALLLLVASVVSYFMDSYGIVIDETMIRNVLKTHTSEAGELFSPQLLVYFLGLGVVPAWLVYRLPVRYASGWGELKRSLGSAVLSVGAITVIALSSYADYASFFRNNNHLPLLLTPTNYFLAVHDFLGSLDTGETPIRPIATDARRAIGRNRQDRPTVFVLVLGETARAQNFSLNGYARPTNAELSRDGVINFDNVSACGTSTAVSVPCMFSRYNRDTFEEGAAEGEENLLNVLLRAGLDVLWRENDSGCKGVCDRVSTEGRGEFGTPEYCVGGSCFDEALLNGLDERLGTVKKDLVIVLHQLGSHGPAYYKRYPERFKVFTPVCDSNQLQNCSRQAIANAYDNTIRYTDHVLHRVIELLKAGDDRYASAMLYLSDHGESLGENNLYLHGMPYFMAPETQTRVPFVFWASEGFEKNVGIDTACLSRHRHEPLSHDNLFHSVLGVLDVETTLYDAGLDLFSECRGKGGAEPDSRQLTGITAAAF